MKNTVITELVMFRLLETATDEQLQQAVKDVFTFHKAQDGFIDSKLVRSTDKGSYVFIQHYASMEHIEAVGPQIAKSPYFNRFKALVMPDSLTVSFYTQVCRAEGM